MNGGVTGGVRQTLRLEALGVLAISLLLFQQHSAAWGVFAAAFLLPDVALLAYLAGPRAGAAAYNLTHSYCGPLLLAAVSFIRPEFPATMCLIWCAHIGMDRALGFGLKYTDGFSVTHLGRVGKGAPS